ncbi:hypothetical protein ANN_21237 [Periplaneta americana]|uniref:Uncharacterized protein n=1 Tax=Periplaneta americana TaxID=6978 RepID=A0ABQ8SES8_PERAM|nr:hypothetical protein ANN_21237 [Periplaneta americana]
MFQRHLQQFYSVVLYDCETCTLTLRDEHRLRVFENKVLRKIFGTKRDEVTGERRKLHNTELHALYSSPDIIRNIKSRRLRWAGHVARIGESRNAYRVLVGRPEGKRPLWRPRRRWENNIKMDLRELGYDDRDWINLAQDRDQWRAYVRAAVNLRPLSRLGMMSRGKWILFLNSTISVQEYFANIYVPVDCEFLVTREAEDSGFDVTLVEVYRPSSSAPLQVHPVANWSATRGMLWTSVTLLNRRKDLHGVCIKAAMIHDVS